MELGKADKSEDINQKPVVDTEKSHAASIPTPEDGQETSNSSLSREPSFKDYLRIFSYAKKWDILLIVIGTTASVGAGITMPLMNVILGRLVGSFNGYFGSEEEIRQAFDDNLNRLSLYMLALFIARFGFNYINKVLVS
jgi:ABC-type microcin C transport system permease subunit YejE